MQVRCLVDVPGEKLPSQVSGALSEYLTSHVANEVRQSPVWSPAYVCMHRTLAAGQRPCECHAGMLSA